MKYRKFFQIEKLFLCGGEASGLSWSQTPGLFYIVSYSDIVFECDFSYFEAKTFCHFGAVPYTYSFLQPKIVYEPVSCSILNCFDFSELLTRSSCNEYCILFCILDGFFQ